MSTRKRTWRQPPGTCFRMTSLCWWTCIHWHEVELSALRDPCDFHHGRVLCWHSRQPHRHKEPFICPRMFKPCSRHAARCPSGLDNKSASICACMHECVCMCVHMPPPPPPPLQWYDPDNPLDPGWVQTACVGGTFHFEMCWISKGHNSVQLCVCVYVCVLVITSWTKLGFQGCWCC